MSFMETTDYYDYPSWCDPTIPSPVPLKELELYSVDSGLYDKNSVLVMPTVLLLELPKLTAENELRAFCLIVDPGSTNIKAGRYAYPLANAFRRFKNEYL